MIWQLKTPARCWATFSRRWRIFCIASCWAWATTTPLMAGPVILDTNVTVPAGSAFATFPLRVQGGDAVQGLNLHVTIEDGGPDVTPGSRVAPPIRDVSTTTAGLVFGPNSDQQNVVTLPQAWVVNTTTQSGTVRADGILAYVTLDTLSYQPGDGPFRLTLEDPAGVDSDFAGIPLSWNEITIQIGAVPEPATCGLLLPLGLALLRVRSRRSRCS